MDIRDIIRNEIKVLLESTKHDKYSAIVLNDISQNKLIEATKNFYPEGWESALSPGGKGRYAHHMTISYSKNLEDIGMVEDSEISFTIDKIGISDLAVAVMAIAPLPMDITPHISLATNRAEGGSRLDSNKIKNWTSITPIKLTGYLKNDA